MTTDFDLEIRAEIDEFDRNYAEAEHEAAQAEWKSTTHCYECGFELKHCHCEPYWDETDADYFAALWASAY